MPIMHDTFKYYLLFGCLLLGCYCGWFWAIETHNNNTIDRTTFAAKPTTIMAQNSSQILQRQQQQQQSLRVGRSLQWGQLSYAVCPLSQQIYYFVYNPVTGLYDIVTNDTNSSVSNNVHNNASDDNNDDVIVATRVCWCTEYFGQPYQFCEAHLDSCAVSTESVDCFQSKPSDTFLRSLWPVIVFFYLAMLYAFSCTEAGRNARKYLVTCIKRFFQCCAATGTNQHSNSQQQPQEQPPSSSMQPTTTITNISPDTRELNRLLQNEPQRAAYMYRNYVIRERRRQQQQQQQSATRSSRRRGWWNRHRTTNAGTNTTTAHSTTSVVWDSTVIDPRLSDRLVLKTKIYSEQNDTEDDNNNNNENNTNNDSPVDEDDDDGLLGQHPHNQNSSSHHDTLPTTETTTPSSAWSLPNLFFSRDRNTESNHNNNDNMVTLEEMDDEMEHGIRCAICLIRLKDGDIIGDIPCGHALHKDCLKDWLKRKNRCPLCQQTGVAKLYHRQQDDGGGGGNHNDTSQAISSSSASTTTDVERSH